MLSSERKKVEMILFLYYTTNRISLYGISPIQATIIKKDIEGLERNSACDPLVGCTAYTAADKIKHCSRRNTGSRLQSFNLDLSVVGDRYFDTYLLKKIVFDQMARKIWHFWFSKSDA